MSITKSEPGGMGAQTGRVGWVSRLRGAWAPTNVGPLPPASIPARYGYISGLDGLRAASIMIVMAGHFFFERWAALSTIGVYIFFGISGYLITRLMLAERDQTGGFDVARFYARRLLRLYPVLIVYLIVIVSVAVMTARPDPLREILSVLFYFTNYLVSWQELHGNPFDLPIGVLWSLSVEEHFYLLMPLFFVATKGRHVIVFALALCVLPIILRVGYVTIWPWLAHTKDTSLLYRNSDVRFDAIAYGVLLAGIGNMREPVRPLRLLGSPGAIFAGGVFLVLSFVMPDSSVKAVLRDTLRCWAPIALICNVLFSQRLMWIKLLLNLPLIAWIGRLSYSLYVWHGGQEYFLTALGLSKQYWGFGIIEFVSTFGCAIGSYYLIEQPALKLKSRLRPRVSVAPQQPPIPPAHAWVSEAQSNASARLIPGPLDCVATGGAAAAATLGTQERRRFDAGGGR